VAIGPASRSSGDYAFVGGGGGNEVAAGNEAFGHYTAILGGTANVAGDDALTNHSLGQRSTVSGGYSNKATGDGAHVSGGHLKVASGVEASIHGGMQKTAATMWSRGELPDYDSGWVYVAPNELHFFTHNLGGNPDNYQVSVGKANDSGCVSNCAWNQRRYGTATFVDYVSGVLISEGFELHGVDAQEVWVLKMPDDPAGRIRFRIWVKD
jgi:hypothetical protein